MTIKHENVLTYIKASWLAGNRREDCAAEIIRLLVKEWGIANEAAIYSLIDATYFTMNNAFYAAMEKVNRNV